MPDFFDVLRSVLWIILQYLTTLIPYDPKTVPPNIDYLQIYVKSNSVYWCLQSSV